MFKGLPNGDEDGRASKGVREREEGQKEGDFLPPFPLSLPFLRLPRRLDSSWLSCRLCDHFNLKRCRSVEDYGPCGLDSPIHCPILYVVGEGVEPDWRLGEIGLDHWFGGDQYMARY